MFRTAIVFVLFTTVSQPAWAQSAADAAPFASKTESLSSGSGSTSVASLVRDLGDDFRDLPSLETALILGVGGGLSLAVHSEDARVTHHFSTSPSLDTLLEPGETAGDGAIQIGTALGVYALGRRLGSHRVALIGADLVRGQIMNTALTLALKVAVGRTRPDGARFSFPSGHTSSSVATATVLQRHLGWRVGLPAYALAAFVGGSRLQENKHYLSDVIFGAAIGMVSGRTTTIGHGRATFAVSPFATRGGGGLGFTLVRGR
jgi:membrane-associated phospholipid phosphatase